MKPVADHKHAKELIAQGYPIVAGVDEVGRGALAGPVVAAAVVLKPGAELPRVRDSKLVPRKEREQLAELIKRSSVAVGVGWVGNDEVDLQGLSWAVCESGKRALDDMGMDFDAVILDGKHNYLKDHCFSMAVVKGDSLSLSVAAASIVAKVARDNYMALQHQLYPRYKFDQNVGYGSAFHRLQLAGGVSPIHRLSFGQVGALYVD